MTPRLVETPLGADALERPSREDVAALLANTFAQPIPAYDADDLRRALRMRYRVRG